MTDPTEGARRALVPQMPAAVAAAMERGEQVWSTDEMRELFSVEGFAAPFVVVRRKADDVRGTLMFSSAPRYYFSFVPE